LGFEYELAQEFAQSIGVRLEVVIPPNRQALLDYLESGRGDLIAE
jgi:membrane-bound lytic murein transglycosylase F